MKEKVEIPQWLKETQNNSYLPELMISGSVIYSLSSFDQNISSFIIDLRANYIGNIPGGGMVLILTSLALYSLFVSIKWGFIVHFLLRAYWVALVGISYTFPTGVNIDNIKQDNYFKSGLKKPIVQDIIKLESVCSSIFGIMVLYSFIMISIILFSIIGMLLINIHEDFSYVFLTLMLTFLFDFLTFRYFRRIPIIKDVLKFSFLFFKFFGLSVLYRKVYYVYSTQFSKLSLNLIFLVFFILGAFSAYPYVSKIMHWPSLSSILETRDYMVKLENTYYEDRIVENDRIPFMAIDSYLQNDDVLSVFINYNVNLSDHFSKIIESDQSKYEFQGTYKEWRNLSAGKRNIEWQNLYYGQSNMIKKLGYSMIDSTEINDVIWVLEDHPRTGQFGWRGYIDIKKLEKGLHTYTVVEYPNEEWPKGKLHKSIVFYKP